MEKSLYQKLMDRLSGNESVFEDELQGASLATPSPSPQSALTSSPSVSSPLTSVEALKPEFSLLPPLKDLPPNPATPSPLLAPPTPALPSLTSMDAPKESEIERLMRAKLNNEQRLTLQLGKEELGASQDLAKLQESRNLTNFIAQLGKAGQSVAEAISGTGPGDKSGWDAATKISEQAILDRKALQEEQKNDPNSNVSKAYREFLKGLGIDVKGDMSAAVGEKLTPLAYKQFELNERLAQRREQELSRKESKEEVEKLRQEGKDAQRATTLASKVQGKTYDDFVKLNTISKNVDKVITDPTSARSIKLIYDFTRSLDPQTGVKDSEIKFVGGLASIPTQFHNVLRKAIRGDNLSDQQKADIIQVIKETANAQKQTWLNSASPYIQQAAKEKLDMGTIVPAGIDNLGIDLGDQATPAAQQAPKKSMALKSAMTPNSTFTFSGKTYKVSQDGKSAIEL